MSLVNEVTPIVGAQSNCLSYCMRVDSAQPNVPYYARTDSAFSRQSRPSYHVTSRVPVVLPAPAPRPQLHKSSGSSNVLASVISPGDVLFVRGTGAIREIGTAGGWLGHVLLVVETPKCISYHTEEARYLEPVWPSGGTMEIWKVRTLESTRANSGLHEGDMLLHIENKRRRLVIIGEISNGHVDLSGEVAELWQSPSELRVRLGGGLVAGVMEEMREHSANWSWATAARAMLRSPRCHGDLDDKDQILQEIMDCWAADPICTSVVIVFWQRCLCKLADLASGAPGTDPADLIFKWLPLKADRSLPGTLLGTMRRCGWKKRTAIPISAVASTSNLVPVDPVSPVSPGEVVPTRNAAQHRSVCIPAENHMPRPQVSTPTLVPLPPRYCSKHDAAGKRLKEAPRQKECSSCRVGVLTSYLDFVLCPPCSERHRRCMICGADAPNAGSYVPATAVPLPHAEPVQPHALMPVLPKFCTTHSRREARHKVEPRLHECTGCHRKVQTSYADFTFCPLCAEKQGRCVICGISCSMGTQAPARQAPGSYLPAAPTPVPVAPTAPAPAAPMVVPTPPRPTASYLPSFDMQALQTPQANTGIGSTSYLPAPAASVCCPVAGSMAASVSISMAPPPQPALMPVNSLAQPQASIFCNTPGASPKCTKENIAYPTNVQLDRENVTNDPFHLHDNVGCQWKA